MNRRPYCHLPDQGNCGYIDHVKQLILSAFVLSPLLLVSCSGPEGDVKSHYESIESIMSDYVDEPGKGMEKLIAYMEDHAAEMAMAEAELAM